MHSAAGRTAAPLVSVEAFEQQLRSAGLLRVVPFFTLAGLALVMTAHTLPDPMVGGSVGVSLIGTSFAASLLGRYGQRASAWALVLGSYFTAITLTVWANAPSMLSLLSVPVGLATLLIRPRIGFLLAIAASAVIVASQRTDLVEPPRSLV